MADGSITVEVRTGASDRFECRIAAMINASACRAWRRLRDRARDAG
jgi:hypothetical protein